jgi:hypothetical protein
MTRAALIRSQLGIESAHGTVVAPTVQLPGLLTMRHDPNRVLREEYRASWGGSNVHDDLSVKSTGQYVGRCTASTLPYWLSGAMRADVTPSGGGPYTRLYAQHIDGTVTIPSLRSYSAYWGDEAGALVSAGTVVTRIVIEGADDAAWTIRCDLLGMGVVAGNFNTGLTTVANETVKNKLTQLFITNDWGALDASIPATTPTTPANHTAKLGVQYGFTWTWDSGIADDLTGGPELTRVALQRAIPSTTLQMRLKWSGVTTQEAVNTINQPPTRRFIRLWNGGSATSIIAISGAYQPMTMDTVSEQRDGTTRATWDLVAVEDTGRKVEVSVTNNVAGSV